MGFNAAELHDAWFGALFAATGALVVNVITSFTIGVLGVLALLLGMTSLICFSCLAQMKADAQRNYVAGVSLRKPEKTLAAIYEDAYGPKQTRANFAFFGGVVALLLACGPVVKTNTTSQILQNTIHQEQAALRLEAGGISNRIQTVEQLLNKIIDTLQLDYSESGNLKEKEGAPEHGRANLSQ